MRNAGFSFFVFILFLMFFISILKVSFRYLANIKTLEAKRIRIMSFGVLFAIIRLIRISLFTNPHRGGIPDNDRMEHKKFGESFRLGLFIDFKFTLNE